MTREEVLEKVSKKREEFISWYHEFHQIPELGFEEKETTELICEKLTGMGIHPLRLDPTGVTAYVGPHDAYTVGLRADIDGLRFQKIQICHSSQSILERCMPADMMVILQAC